MVYKAKGKHEHCLRQVGGALPHPPESLEEVGLRLWLIYPDGGPLKNDGSVVAPTRVSLPRI